MKKEIKFVAYLLFQFRVLASEKEKRKRICEEKIYHIYAISSEDAYEKSLNIGRDEEFSYRDGEKKIFYEFIGVIDLIELCSLENSDIVWHRFVEKVNPMERKNKLIPKKENLTVFKIKNKIKL